MRGVRIGSRLSASVAIPPLPANAAAFAGKGGQGGIRLCGYRRMTALSPRPQRPSIHLWQERPRLVHLAQAASTPRYKRGV